MEHNIFISYAWVDNEVYPGGEKGWISTFVDGLRKHLARELGRRDQAERLWLDYEQMRGNASVTPAIRAHVEASRTLVLFLSNGYLASDWCRQELETFAAGAGADAGRIFVVQMTPVEQEPEVLRDLVKYSFWYTDEQNKPRTRWFPHIDPTDREYAPAQQSLARDLAAKLGEMLASDAPAPVAHRPSSDAPPVPAEPAVPVVPAKPETGRAAPRPVAAEEVGSDRLVLVSGGAQDCDLIHAVAKQLEHRKLGVAVPLCAVPDQEGIKSSALTRDLRTKLSLCDSVLMVFRRGPLDQVSQHLIECLKASARAPKSRTPPSIDLCQTRADSLALGLHPSGMRIHVVGEACADECVEWFLDETPPC
jgi:hypothetical protein